MPVFCFPLCFTIHNSGSLSEIQGASKTLSNVPICWESPKNSMLLANCQKKMWWKCQNLLYIQSFQWKTTSHWFIFWICKVKRDGGYLFIYFYVCTSASENKTWITGLILLFFIFFYFLSPHQLLFSLILFSSSSSDEEASRLYFMFFPLIAGIFPSVLDSLS